MTGTIKTLSERGFGFIQGEDGISYFFHKSALSDSKLFDELREGDTLELVEIANTDKGWRANIVKPVAPAALADVSDEPASLSAS